MKPLAIVPTYMREPGDLQLVIETLESFRESKADADLLVIDDGSPAGALVDEMAGSKSRLEFDLIRKQENEGFSRTVNAGLRRASDEGRDALLVNSDLIFFEEGWLEHLQAEQDAAVVGALLLYPTGLIQHAGVFFSRLHRVFSHRYQFGPGDLPEAQVPHRCPVTAALHLIRYEALDTVGLYDEEFRMGFEDVDYCLRVFQAGLECRYAPRARAFHLESVFRGRTDPNSRLAKWQRASFYRLYEKWPQRELLKWASPIV